MQLSSSDLSDGPFSGGSEFVTGDVKLSFTTSQTGWVLMNDGTIGNASSGASTRANADTQNLFILLWNNVSDTYCAVSGGRGSTAAADYAANKTIALPKTLGRGLAVSGAGSGLTSRSLGQTYGVETVQLTSATMPSHTHIQNSHNHTQDAHLHSTTARTSVRGTATDGWTGGTLAGYIRNTNSTTATNQATTATNQNTGSDGYHENMPPEIFMNVFIKL